MAEHLIPLVGIIPARISSSRFPEKPLAQIGNQTVIARVVKRALAARVFDVVLVATDDDRIAAEALKAGAEAFLTPSNLSNGTLRSFHALQQWEVREGCVAEAVVNIQGDEPFVHPEQLQRLAHLIRLPGTSIATLARPMDAQSPGRENPNRVKVVCDLNGDALYFSRAPLPHSDGPWFEHVGLYAFNRSALEALCLLHPTSLEKREQLEQLRWLEHGWKIRVGNSNHATHAVDTPEDLIAIESLFNSGELT